MTTIRLVVFDFDETLAVKIQSRRESVIHNAQLIQLVIEILQAQGVEVVLGSARMYCPYTIFSYVLRMLAACDAVFPSDRTYLTATQIVRWLTLFVSTLGFLEQARQLRGNISARLSHAYHLERPSRVDRGIIAALGDDPDNMQAVLSLPPVRMGMAFFHAQTTATKLPLLLAYLRYFDGVTLQPEQILLVDDREDLIDNAKQMGFQGIKALRNVDDESQDVQFLCDILMAVLGPHRALEAIYAHTTTETEVPKKLFRYLLQDLEQRFLWEAVSLEIDPAVLLAWNQWLEEPAAMADVARSWSLDG
ncbi:MAG: hypothetical protein A3J38_09820 [Gammaproteobacteria bacterium RIFCSPHIGHO2_12_FULL_45_9]|nr:MAG: hypothetical protein A3J38_09820 [Gammaproteobacteria bacterium RIFCSPHIGHO2_12_FULL_45_9]